MLIIGHRGAAGLEPENTIGSFKKAIELGVDAVEMDLRLDRNGVIVVAHDADPEKIYPRSARLTEVLKAVNVALHLEIKESGFEKQLLEMIKDFPSEVLISSFKLKILRKIRSLDRNIKLGLAINQKMNRYFSFLILLSHYLRIYSIHPHYSLLTAARMWWMRRLGFQIYTFVINEQNLFEDVKRLGVDGVFTDHPDVIRQ
ncbi:MAG: glycerophosphodiester phosphodiesterase [Candidatus Doudnabacteria bacterium]|nr:glycerophosphodiester phosphodiesterase [Candidatus Doudnabacteria bacterium]